MQTRSRASIVCLFLAAAAVSSAVPNDSLQQVLARMDKAAAEFKAMTAKVEYITHTDVLNDDERESGTVTMKNVQPGEVQGRVDFTVPDQKIITFEKRKLQQYLPKINTLQVYDLAKHGEQLDKFLKIGFGTSGTELAKDYDVTVLGPANVQGQSATHLQLIPKDLQTRRDYVQKLELWLPDTGDPYPLQEKIIEPSGDYRLVIYSSLKINPPLKPDALQLKLPADVKIEHPGQ